MARTGLAGARDRVAMLVKAGPLNKRLRGLQTRAPDRAKKAMGQAAAWWHAQALPHLPVRGAVGTHKKTGRGQLKKRTQPWVKATADGIAGGIRSMVDWAIWLYAGTRTIAGGKVMRWKPGQATITSWPAKDDGGGNPRGELPIIAPWHHNARTKLRELLAAVILR